MGGGPLMDSDYVLRQKKYLKELLQDPMYLATVQDTKERIVFDMLSTKPEDKDKRESLYQEILALDRLVGRLTALCNDVTVQEANIKKKEHKNG